MSTFATAVEREASEDAISEAAESMLLDRSKEIQLDRPTIDASLKNLMSYLLAIYITRNASSVTSSNDFNDNNANNSDHSRNTYESLVARFEKLDHVVTTDMALKTVQIMSKAFNLLLARDDDNLVLPSITTFLEQLSPQGDEQSASDRLEEIIRYKCCYFLYSQVKKVEGGKLTKLFGRLFLVYTRAFDLVEKIADKLNQGGVVVPAPVLSIFCDTYRSSLGGGGGDGSLQSMVWAADFTQALRLRQAERARSRGALEEGGQGGA